MTGDKTTHAVGMLAMWVGITVGAILLLVAVALLTGWLRNRRDLADLDDQAAQHEQVAATPLDQQTIAVLQEATVLVPIIDKDRVAKDATRAEFDETFSFIYWEHDLAFEDALVRFGLDGDELHAVVAMSTAGRESAVTEEIPVVREAVAV